MVTPEKKYLTIQEFSGICSLSVSTLRRRVLQGTIAFFQPGGPGTLLLFPCDALERSAREQPPSLSKFDELNPTPKRLPGRRPAWVDAPEAPQP